jgi:hypothetical protein
MTPHTNQAATLFRRIATKKRCGLVVGVLVFALAGPAAASASLQPIGLSVDEGEESWHSEPSFALRWTNPQQPIAAVHYRLLWPSGEEALGETIVSWPETSLQHLAVPPFPGAYTAEVWLEDADGAEGTPVSATLRFDDARPGPVAPLADDDWIGRAAFPYAIHLSHPDGPQPLSGIRGYALAIDRGGSGAPCAGPYICSEAETDLRSGVAGDTLAIADLPEGIDYLRAVAVSGSGMRSAAVGTAALKVDKTDPLTTLAGAPEGWSNAPLRLIARSNDLASGMAAGGVGGPFTAIRVDGGSPTTAAGDRVETTVIGSGTHAVGYYARDAAGNVAGSAGDLASTTVRIDRDRPAVAFVNTQDPRDPERIEARASDTLSGLAATGGSIAVRRAGAGERFAELPTQLLGGVLSARWNSEAAAPGEYEFRATVRDRAGNAGTSLSRGNGASMRLRSPLKIATTLLATSGRRDLPYGRSTSFGGRLLSGRHATLADAAVQVVERFAAGAVPRERITTVRTSGSGEFSVHLAAGPSREVFARAVPSATTRGGSSQPLRLAVRSGVRLRVSAHLARIGGRPVVFSGRVAAAGTSIPAEGKTVQLQFRLPGLAWSEFRTIRTDPRGRFRYPYRFADDDSRGVRFQFRAFTPAQAGWPFEPAGSTPVAIRGL